MRAPSFSPSARWAAVAALLLGNFLLHKPISNVCDWLFVQIGRTPYELVTLLAISAASLLGAAMLLRARPPQARPLGIAPRRRRLALAALLVCTILAQHWLLVSNVELIHLPQFGLLAALLLAADLSPSTAWLAATAGGVLDETYQRVVIYAAVPDVYFDWNDIVLNAIGAALAVVLVAPMLPAAAPAGRRRVWMVGAACAGLALAWRLAPPHVVALPDFPYWRPTLGHALTGRDYHVMAASEGVAALLLVWGIVGVGAGGGAGVGAGRDEGGDREGGGECHRRAVTLILFLALAMTMVTCVPHSPTPAPTPAPAPFIVTFWCGPPLAELTDARAAEIAAAGFTVVGAPCEGMVNPALNHRALDVAARHGLRLWITDPRVDLYYDPPPDWAARMDAAVAEYGGHPALGGYFLIDEPSATRFDDLGTAVAHLRAVDPGHLPYINLLPDYASTDALGTATYREHVERYLASVRPPLLSFDYYPFRTDGDRPSFFANLELIRDVARRERVPFLFIAQAMPHGPYRDPTEAELSWQVFHAVAFGAGGISYFAYWTPVAVPDAEKWNFRHGLVEAGQPTAHFWQAARINRSVRAFAAALAGFRSIAILDSAGRFGQPLPVAAIEAIEGGPVTVGVFESPRNEVRALVVNQDYRDPRRVRLVLADGAAPLRRFDVDRAGWVDGAADIDLPAGGAVLLEWARPVSIVGMRHRLDTTSLAAGVPSRRPRRTSDRAGGSPAPPLHAARR